MQFLFKLLFICIFFLSGSVNASKRTFNIYHDSDYSNHAQSANAMKMGFLTALSQHSEALKHIEFKFIEKDHRGNSNRSLMHMKQFLADDDALLMLGGLHSPPYIKYKDFISKNGILLLVPWAAGGPITRYAEPENWVFRLSVDDSKAGSRIVNFAQQQLNCQQPHMLLEQTPWGKSNYSTMKRALNTERQDVVTWFNWNTKFNQAKILLRDVVNRADCVLFVGNAIEGLQFVKAMAALPNEQRIPIVSHWGITGGDFFSRAHQYLGEEVKLNFIQTCYSVEPDSQSELAKRVSNDAALLFPNEFSGLEKLAAPAGFVHSYDLAKLFLGALANINLEQDIGALRAALRNQLEMLDQPIQGLIKTYQLPFTKWSQTQPDSHEALGLENLCMAEYKSNGGIRVFNNEEH